MERKLNKPISLLLAVILFCLTFMLVSCGARPEDKIVGSWYDDGMSELFFSEDGTYTLYGDGGTYSVDGDRITLLDSFGGADTFAFYDDGDETYIYDMNGSWIFYPYDVAYDIYCTNQAEAESKRMSTVDAIKEYLIGTWTGGNSLHNYVVTIKEDNTYVIEDDPYYEDTSHSGIIGTWSFESDGMEERYFFTETHVLNSNGKEYTHDTFFYIPDWENKDLNNIRLRIGDITVTKQ